MFFVEQASSGLPWYAVVVVWLFSVIAVLLIAAALLALLIRRRLAILFLGVGSFFALAGVAIGQSNAAFLWWWLLSAALIIVGAFSNRFE